MIVDPLSKSTPLIVQMCELALANVKSARVQEWKATYYTSDDFEREFSTVKVALPRQQGHTTAAMELVAKHPGSIMFVLQHDMKRDIEYKFREYIFDTEKSQRACGSVLTLQAIKDNRNHMLRKNYRPFLIFDGVSRMNTAYITEAKTLFPADVYVELQ